MTNGTPLTNGPRLTGSDGGERGFRGERGPAAAGGPLRSGAARRQDLQTPLVHPVRLLGARLHAGGCRSGRETVVFGDYEAVLLRGVIRVTITAIRSL